MRITKTKIETNSNSIIPRNRSFTVYLAFFPMLTQSIFFPPLKLSNIVSIFFLLKDMERFLHYLKHATTVI